jgi:hypothetical protein
MRGPVGGDQRIGVNGNAMRTNPGGGGLEVMTNRAVFVGGSLNRC